MRKDDALGEFLERAVDTPLEWGAHDCALWPADWVVESGWPDPAAEWRGRYRTALGAARLVRSCGSLKALWARNADQIGLPTTMRPIAGDVGLVIMPTRAVGPTLAGAVGGICLGRGEWCLTTSKGVWMGRPPVIQAWRVKWRTR